MGYPPANFGDTTIIRFQFMSHWANTAQTEHVTFEVMAPVTDAGRRPLSVQKIWHTMCVSIDVLGDPDLLTLKLVSESNLRWETFLPNMSTLGLWVLNLFAMYATDGQKQCLLAPTITKN